MEAVEVVGAVGAVVGSGGYEGGRGGCERGERRRGFLMRKKYVKF